MNREDLISAGVLDALQNEILNFSVLGIDNLIPYILAFLALMATFTFFVDAKLYRGEVDINELILWLVKVTFFSFLISNWVWVLDSVYAFGQEIGSIAGLGKPEDVLSPSSLISMGFDTAGKLFNKLLGGDGFWGTVGSLGLNAIAYAILSLLIVLLFGYIGFSYLLATVELYIVGTLAMVLIPFQMIRQTKEISNRIWSFLVSSSVKIMVLSFMLLMTSPFLTSVADVMPSEYGGTDSAIISAMEKDGYGGDVLNQDVIEKIKKSEAYKNELASRKASDNDWKNGTLVFIALLFMAYLYNKIPDYVTSLLSGSLTSAPTIQGTVANAMMAGGMAMGAYRMAQGGYGKLAQGLAGAGGKGGSASTASSLGSSSGSSSSSSQVEGFERKNMFEDTTSGSRRSEAPIESTSQTANQDLSRSSQSPSNQNYSDSGSRKIQEEIGQSRSASSENNTSRSENASSYDSYPRERSVSHSSEESSSRRDTPSESNEGTTAMRERSSVANEEATSSKENPSTTVESTAPQSSQSPSEPQVYNSDVELKDSSEGSSKAGYSHETKDAVKEAIQNRQSQSSQFGSSPDAFKPLDFNSSGNGTQSSGQSNIIQEKIKQQREKSQPDEGSQKYDRKK